MQDVCTGEVQGGRAGCPTSCWDKQSVEGPVVSG